ELGRHRLARPAPRRPEVDHDGDVISSDVALERLSVERDGVALEEPLFAFPARGRVTEPLARHAIRRTAMRTDDVGGVGCSSRGHDSPATWAPAEGFQGNPPGAIWSNVCVFRGEERRYVPVAEILGVRSAQGARTAGRGALDPSRGLG